MSDDALATANLPSPRPKIRDSQRAVTDFLITEPVTGFEDIFHDMRLTINEIYDIIALSKKGGINNDAYSLGLAYTY